MVVQLLGTGAADGIPALFENSRVSDYARKHGGKDVRTRCGAIIDGHLKIDFPPDTFSQLVLHQLNALDWSAIVFTHSDHDHFAVREIQYAMFPFNDEMSMPFPMYGNSTICEMIWDRYPNWPIEMHQTKSFESFSVSGFEVTPIAANHTRGEDCHNLLIAKDGKTFLYGTDTGVWHEPTWEFLKGWKLDGLVIESTNGKSEPNYWGHLNFASTIEVVDRLRKMGSLSDSAPVVTTHHSQDGDMTHDELVEAFAPYGISVGYDGIEFTV